MSVNQDVQEKCQKEIDQVLGSKIPGKSDQAKLVYVSATLQEIFRMGCAPPPITMAHIMKDDYVSKHGTFPKGAFVISNTMKFAMDPMTFPDPKTFKPERFIENGKLKTYPQLAPFGIGKRICMGETMARDSSFIFFTRILQTLNIRTAKGEARPDPLNCEMKGTKAPLPFYVHVAKR